METSHHKNIYYCCITLNGINIYIYTSSEELLYISLKTPKENSDKFRLTKVKEDDPYMLDVPKQLKEYFEGKRKKFSVKMDLSGTPFQLKVWKELTKIPYGKTISYKDLAKKTGDVKAVRAVGTANGHNPIPIIIPCHRVINSNGELGGYSGGLDIKVILLTLEGVLEPSLL
ncbi:MAG: methylated-DNA--[protein]-cysteine S-methyltransferase [Ignavibacteriaceae bacterium]|nr:methylated-DNA--[protein]-cysteine S-methyltransferase [Ignavibacteriaceae bacterium]HRI46867.1 methylated-DNA--[protein]-cysteine S-methyltransferase [Ignavibacteriaceae bacterium]